MRANCDLDVLLINKVLPLQMPRPDVFRPGVTIFARFMRPVMRFDLAALRDNRGATRRAYTSSLREWVLPLSVDECACQQCRTPATVVCDGLLHYFWPIRDRIIPLCEVAILPVGPASRICVSHLFPPRLWIRHCRAIKMRERPRHA